MPPTLARSVPTLLAMALLGLALFGPPSRAALADQAPTPPEVPASGPVTGELAALLARLPSEHTPDPGEHYPVSNEWRHDLFLPSIRDLGGIFVGVGPDQCYTLAAMQGAQLAILVDFDLQVPLVHRMYEVLVGESATPDELVARFDEGQARATSGLLERGLAGDARAPAILRLFDRHRARWSRYLRAVRRSTRDGVPGSWLADEALYGRVRALFREGRVVALNGDVTASMTMRSVGRLTRLLELPVRVLYLSNAEQFFPYTRQFAENVGGLAMDERSVVLRTFRASGATYPARDRWHYVVEPLAGFRARLGEGLTRSRQLELEIVRDARRARDATPGLTILAR